MCIVHYPWTFGSTGLMIIRYVMRSCPYAPLLPPVGHMTNYQDRCHCSCSHVSGSWFQPVANGCIATESQLPWHTSNFSCIRYVTSCIIGADVVVSHQQGVTLGFAGTWGFVVLVYIRILRWMLGDCTELLMIDWPHQLPACSDRSDCMNDMAESTCWPGDMNCSYDDLLFTECWTDDMVVWWMMDM